MTDSNHEESPAAARAPESVIDRGTLDGMLNDVGPENAQTVLDAFIEELRHQTQVLAEAGDKADLDGMVRSAHRLKSSTASLGALRLSRLILFIEDAARRGNMSAATGKMAEFRTLSMASLQAMVQIQREITNEPV